jgi:hypothetical protein
VNIFHQVSSRTSLSIKLTILHWRLFSHYTTSVSPYQSYSWIWSHVTVKAFAGIGTLRDTHAYPRKFRLAGENFLRNRQYSGLVCNVPIWSGAPPLSGVCVCCQTVVEFLTSSSIMSSCFLEVRTQNSTLKTWCEEEVNIIVIKSWGTYLLIFFILSKN